MDLKTFNNIARLKDIAMVLVRHGFGDIVQRLNLPIKGLAEKVSSNIELDADIHVRIRLVLEELGPTFIKLGQMMSLRPDLFPIPMIRELSKLQDQVAPLPFDEIRQVLENEFGETIQNLFYTIDPEPVATASLSQVHRAVLERGEAPVAVKVRRPGIRAVVETDLNIMETLAAYCHDHMEHLRMYDLPKVVVNCRRSLLNEIDFAKEAQNIRIARTAISNPEIVIPDVISKYSNESILVMEYIQGSRLTALDQMDDNLRKALARAGLRTGIYQILKQGFFHADPHPGNIIITTDQKLCLLDWGMVGRLTEEERINFLHMIQAIVDGDNRALADRLISITVVTDEVNVRQLRRGLQNILDSYLALPLEDLRVGDLLADIVSVLKEHHLGLPPEMTIVIKTVMTLEGTARMLYPQLDVVSESEPLIRELMERQYSSKQIWRRLRRHLSSLWSFQKNVPARLSSILRKMENDRLTIRFEHQNLDHFQTTLESIFNRLTLGIVLGAMIIGSSMIITTGVKPLLFGYPAFGIIGYLISGVLALWLIFTIIRGRDF